MDFAVADSENRYGATARTLAVFSAFEIMRREIT